MHPSRAQAAPRGRPNGRRHPLGRARRRWPEAYVRAYDGAAPEPRINPRYDESYHTERRRSQGVNGRRSRAMEKFRRTPIRNGLIGLAVAGTAVPIIANRHQEALRTDPSHERAFAQQSDAPEINDEAVSDAWHEMLAEAEANPGAVDRESAIQESLERYREYGVSRSMAEDIYDAAVENGIDPATAFGLVRAESSFRNTARSPVGAQGLTQLMPRTAAWVEPGTTTTDLRNQQTNLRIGFKYLSQLVDKYNGNEDLALLAYNRGPGTVDRALKRGMNPDNGYAKFVRGEANHGHSLYTNR
jgi:hypothetical protein